MAYRNGLPLVAALLVCLMPSIAAAQVDYIDPAGGFTQVVTTTHDGVKTIFLSGQVGQGDTLREHVESAFAGVVRRLEQAGATPEDVVKVRIFVKDFEPAQYPVVAEVRLATFPEGHWPASTMIGVRELFAETLRVEIEAIAVVAEPGADLEIERFNPSNGFNGAVAVTAHGVKTVYVAGQVGGGDTLAAQTTAVWGRVGQQLEAAGASFAKESPSSHPDRVERERPRTSAGRAEARAGFAGPFFELELRGTRLHRVPPFDGSCDHRTVRGPASSTIPVAARNAYRISR